MRVRELVAQGFERRFEARPTFVVRAPGRVNLIGEHTDYNDGFVLPMAINRAIWIALRPRTDGRVVVHALDLDHTTRIALGDLENTNEGWAEYLKGVAWALQEEGYLLQGWEGVLAGDVPREAGLSSSAALEVATARAFAAVSDLPWNAAKMAQLCQRAENDWVGMKCGIMDQLISAAGQAGHALLIDCRSLETELVPLPSGTAVVVLDTATRRGLVDSAYNERRRQCEAAARFFGVPALRDVSIGLFETRSGELDEVTLRRARHVITENARTLQTAEAMRRDDSATMGRLMNASHASLRDDFEVSSEALNEMVECAKQEEGCHGVRMTGAGFGGCAIALIRGEMAVAFSANVAACYQETTGSDPSVSICTAASGAEVVLGPAS
jgi:galactokinase